jgi:hypothetical protein
MPQTRSRTIAHADFTTEHEHHFAAAIALARQRKQRNDECCGARGW